MPHGTQNESGESDQITILSEEKQSERNNTLRFGCEQEDYKPSRTKSHRANVANSSKSAHFRSLRVTLPKIFSHFPLFPNVWTIQKHLRESMDVES